MVHVYEDYGYSTYHVHYVEYVHRFRLLRFVGCGLGISVTASLNVKLCFNNASIMEIINAVGRRHNVKIYLETDKYYQDRITAKFVHGETELEIMDALVRLMPGLHYRINSLGEIYIY